MRRSRRGISEIVAALLMVLIVVSIGAALFSYSSMYFSSATIAANTNVVLEQLAMSEHFTILDVWFNSSPGITSIAVYNYGEVEVEVAAVFVNGTLYTASTVVGVGEVKWVNISMAGLSGEVYRIKVVSSRGNSYEGLFRA